MFVLYLWRLREGLIHFNLEHAQLICSLFLISRLDLQSVLWGVVFVLALAYMAHREVKEGPLSALVAFEYENVPRN